MEIIIGENNSNGRSKVQKKLGEKIYYYNGKADKVAFLEEIIYTTTIQYKKELEKENFCSIACFKGEKYVISFFNDITDEKPNGDSSIEYSFKDFSEEEIKSYIQLLLKEHKYTKDKMILLSIEKDVFTFSNLKNEKEEIVSINKDELQVELVISGYKKYSKVYILTGILVGIISIGLIGQSYLNSYQLEKINTLETSQKKLEKDKRTLDKEIIEEKIKFNKLEVKKNLLDKNNLKELEKKVSDLKLPEPLK